MPPPLPTARRCDLPRPHRSLPLQGDPKATGGCLSAKVPKLPRLSSVEGAAAGVLAVLREAVRPALLDAPQSAQSLCVHLWIVKPYLMLNGTT